MTKILLSLSLLILSTTGFNKSNDLFQNDDLQGIRKFYTNHTEYELCLGVRYGCHNITSVSVNHETGRMKIYYAYKSGLLTGYIESNGSYNGDYETTSTQGNFGVTFQPDGTATGEWKSERIAWFFSASGPLSIKLK